MRVIDDALVIELSLEKELFSEWPEGIAQYLILFITLELTFQENKCVEKACIKYFAYSHRKIYYCNNKFLRKHDRNVYCDLSS